MIFFSSKGGFVLCLKLASDSGGKYFCLNLQCVSLFYHVLFISGVPLHLNKLKFSQNWPSSSGEEAVEGRTLGDR